MTMKNLLSFLLILAAFGCKEGNEGRDTSSRTGLDDGAAGSGGGDFGNPDPALPPPPSGAVIQEGGGCKSGHYLGQLEGTYLSSVAFGMAVPISTDPTAVDAAILTMLFPPADGVSPGFEFWLEASDETEPCAGDQEFCFDFKVEGGTAKGVANGLFPFEMELNGDLDCDQGKFQGLLENGWYEVAGLRFMYEGTIEADYDASMSAFFNGTWEVTEPADPMAGGDGTWWTAFVDDGAEDPNAATHP